MYIRHRAVACIYIMHMKVVLVFGKVFRFSGIKLALQITSFRLFYIEIGCYYCYLLDISTLKSENQMKQNKTPKRDGNIRDHVELEWIEMEWNGRNTITKNEQNDGEKKRKEKTNYNSQYCWPAAVQFESDGVVRRANECERERSLGRWAGPTRGRERERLYLYTFSYRYIPTDSTKYETTINNLTLYTYISFKVRKCLSASMFAVCAFLSHNVRVHFTRVTTTTTICR